MAFMFTLGRLAETFHSILTAEPPRNSDVARGAVYVFIPQAPAPGAPWWGFAPSAPEPTGGTSSWSCQRLENREPYLARRKKLW